MRYFKHMTDADQDPFLQYVIRKWGMRGLGWYWSLIELIAGRGKPIVNDEGVEISWAVGCTWADVAKKLRTKRAVAREFLSSCSAFAEHLQSIYPESAKITFTESEDFLRLDCPNILKIKDDYTRKSGLGPAQVRTSVPTKGKGKGKGKGEGGDSPDDMIRIEELMRLVKAAKIPGRTNTNRTYVEAWVARLGFDAVKEVLTSAQAKGRSVLWLDDNAFGGKSKTKQSRKEKRDALGD